MKCGEIAAWNAPAKDERVGRAEWEKRVRGMEGNEGRATICREAGKMHWAQLSV